MAGSDLLDQPAFSHGYCVVLLLEEVVLDPEGQAVHDDWNYHDDKDEF